MSKKDIITPDEAVTLDGLFARRVERSPDRTAYRYFDASQKAWHAFTWQEMADRVAVWQAAFLAEGFRPGDRVAVQLRNGPDWVMFDIAALSLGLVTVPLYTDDRPDNIAYILAKAGVALLLVQDAGRWARLADQIPAAESGGVRRVLLLDDSEAAKARSADDERVRLVADWLPAEAAPLHVRDHADGHALASIVYTSGTTGRPKGVMLSHRNMLSVAYGGLCLLDCYVDDVFLSFLPLSHTLERTAGYYLCMMTGSTVAYARSVAQLGEDLKTIRPSVIISVPRVFERVYGRIRRGLMKKGRVPSLLFDLAVVVGWQRFLHEQGRAGWSPKQLLWPVLQRLVASKIVAGLGGRLRIAVSGGAALGDEVARVFIALGVPIVQGYGLTETSPVISVNPLQDNRPSSVGLPIPGVEVRIGDDEELQVRGGGVMLGYWGDADATASVLEPDGWLHTGDQARIGDSGHVYLTGRIKDILVLSNGEKVPPGDIESALIADPLIEQAMLVGEGRAYLVALLVLDAEVWRDFAGRIGVPPNDPESLSRPETLSAVRKHVQGLLRQFPGYAKVRQVHLSVEPWTIEQGLLTPTLKLKRAQVLQHHSDAVDSMYSRGAAD